MTGTRAVHFPVGACHQTKLLGGAKIKNQGRKLILFVAGLAIFGLSLWAYGISYATIDITPNEQQIIATNKPTISVNWPYALGAKLKKAKVLLDGRDISADITLRPRGFTYKTPKNLVQGIHVISAELEYNILYKKKVSLKWFFTTDTVAPRIILNERHNTLASRTPDLGLKGSTEPFSLVSARFNDENEMQISANKKGDFSLNLSGLKKNNDLLLMAKDRAGNVTKRKLTVIIDTEPPIIQSLSPNHGSLVFTADADHSLKAVLKDKESGVSKAVMLINGQVAQTKYDRKKDELIHLGPLNKDGRYEAKIEVYDVAGNKLTKTWHFEVDTSKIVVDQSDFRLYLYKENKVVHTVSVAVGMPTWPTPNGNWKVEDKRSMPTWRNPHTSWSASMPHSIGPGPRNPLGLRAIYLSAPGIRIHGTSAYYSIGRRASHGCIRVRNPEVVVLYPKVRVGTPVIIRP